MRPDSPMVVVLRATYRPGDVEATLDDRRRNLSGFLLMVIRIGPRVEAVLASDQPAGIDIFLYDAPELGPPFLLYTHRSRTRDAAGERGAVDPPAGSPAGLEYRRTFAAAGRRWLVLCRPAPAFLNTHRSWTSPVVLGSGLVLTLLLAGLVANLLARKVEVERLVQKRTAELVQETQAHQRMAKVALEAQNVAEVALAKIKTLRGLLPLCAWCRKVRDDQGYWQQVEVFIQENTDATVTHGVCPECARTMTSDVRDVREPH